MTLARALEEKSRFVNRALNQSMIKAGVRPGVIHEAMRYSLFAGGKRLRPILCLAAAELCGGKRAVRKALPVACALEMIHTYSLIHDDLPAMDDDDLRRGRPTCHKKYGEAVAVLAGDGLLTRAFEVVADAPRRSGLDPQVACAVAVALGRAAGSLGMVGGQAADLESEGLFSRSGHPVNPSSSRLKKKLEYIHRHKTGALLAASLEAGAQAAGASGRQRRCLRAYGESIGLAFQIADDVLDVIGNKKLLGKSGSDKTNGKLTFPAVYGLEKARRMARAQVERAKRALTPFGRRAVLLKQLADFIVERNR